MGARELAEWEVFNEFEPFGEEREDLRMGILASTIANVNRGKSQRAMKPNEFIPEFRNWGAGGKEAAVANKMKQTMLGMVGRGEENGD